MYSLKTITATLALLATSASARPSNMRLTDGELKIYEVSKRQNEAATALGLGELDVLQL
jgi:uncharacterized membrane protein